jgi:hypothetical protein
MIKRSLMALTLLLALVACTPGASPTVTIPASLPPLPSLGTSPDASESPSGSEEPTGSDEEETESPSAS